MGSDQSNIEDLSEELKRINEAERKAKYYFDWINCARCRSDLGNRTESGRCIKAAEGVA